MTPALSRRFMPLCVLTALAFVQCSSTANHEAGTDGGMTADASEQTTRRVDGATSSERSPSLDGTSPIDGGGMLADAPDVRSATDSQPQQGDAGGGQAIKWTPGYYVLTDAQLQPGRPLSDWQGELNDALAAKPTVQGFALFTTWAALEWKTEANWQFGGGAGSNFVLDQIVDFCRTNGLKLVLIINPDVFNSGTPSAPSLSGDNGNLPYYLLTDPATYGQGLYGNSNVTQTGASGFWVQQTGGFCANFENANVMARMVAMLQHLGEVYDADPVVEAVIFDAWDAMYPFTGTGATGPSFFTGVQDIMTAAKSAFPTTNVAIQAAWGGTPAQSMVEWLVKNQMMVSTSDTGGLTGFEPGSGRAVTAAATPTGTSGTLASAWGTTTGYYSIKFSTGQTVTALLTQDSKAVTWSPAVTGSPTTSIETSRFPTQLSDGIQAWMGIQAVGAGSTWTPPSPPLMSYGSSFPLVEGGDFSNGNPYGSPFTIGDIIDAANQKYKASHLAVTHLASNQAPIASAVWSNVLPVLQAKPLVNTGYPASYPR